MDTNGVSTPEDAEMPECDGEKVVTMMDVLQEQQDFEDDANAVLGASDDKECTYSKGYIKRQAIYACLTCCSEAKADPAKRAGVCLACSLNCHEGHELVELYTKRNFRCDCGNPHFNSHPCQYTPSKTQLNNDNNYNQNFSGLYCTCHRPYPDPDNPVEDEMIQCIMCEDWLHSSHLEATVPGSDQFSEMICKLCMEKNDFLHDYTGFAVNILENEDVDVTNDSIIKDSSFLNGDSTKDEGNNDSIVGDVNSEAKPDEQPVAKEDVTPDTDCERTEKEETGMNFLDEMSAFDRERIPERVVHAKGAGAFGYFEVTHDVSKYCAAKVFDTVGKRTPIAVRFSTVGGESGSADTVRDPRGFAVKFYTEDGNWDIVGNNTPIFFIRDPTLFPSFIHTQKRNPATHLKDPDMFWDFLTLRPESVHQVLFLFADRGLPDGYRHMNGYGSHTFKLVNAQGVAHWAKFHYKTDQGIRNLPAARAAELSASDPDYSIRDLYNAIARGEFPSWTFYLQVMTAAEAESCKFNPFDLTKVWSHHDYPLIPVGRLVLDRNPRNYFAEVEQIAFSPANLVPGIEPSPDKMLQGRLFSYSDTHRHRLGANFLQIPVNCPYRARVSHYQRDGPQNITDNQEGCPNYFPNSFSGPQECPRAARLQPRASVSGDVDRYDSGQTEDNFAQATLFYTRTLDAAARARLAENLVDHLKDAAGFLQQRAVAMFSQVHPELGAALAAGLAPYKKYHANL